MNPDDSVLRVQLKQRPLFIVFEGIDGSGKSTHARLLADRLERAGIPVLLTREPSDGPIGLRIRTMSTRPSPEEETRLFTEDRRDHVSHVIEPALANGVTVICDRYVLSSAAYQGARGLDPRAIIADNHSFARRPDVTFLLLIPVAEALDRIANSREEGFSLFEARRDLEAVDAVYRSLIDQTVTTIDAAKEIGAIQEELIRHLQSIPPVDRQESHSAETP